MTYRAVLLSPTAQEARCAFASKDFATPLSWFAPHRTVDDRVTTTGVAPTILKALGLDPDARERVRKEETKALP